MTRREGFFVLVATAAGFLGGTVSGGLRTVQAQERNWPKTLTAERFVVMDSGGNRRVEIGVENDGHGGVRIYDENGRLTWSAPDAHIWPAGREHRP